MSELGKTSAEQLVYESIKDAFYKRKLAPGTAMTEQSLCDAFGVSRTPVRGALHKLADEGFVEIIANRGAFVIQADKEKITQIYDVRVELETFAFRKGIDRFTEEDKLALNRLINQEEEAFAQRDLKKYLEINEEFHIFLVSKANNQFLSDLFQQVYHKLLIYLVFYDNFYVPMNKNIFSIENNRKIVEALEKKNLEELDKLIRLQCQNTVKALNSGSIVDANVGTVFAKHKL